MPVVKILGIRSLDRYAMRRCVQAAWICLAEKYPGQILDLSEIRLAEEVAHHTACVVLPSLMINDQLVCAGRIPCSEEIMSWLKSAME